MTRLAAVIASRNGAEAERQARAALGNGADLVELRLDHIPNLNSGVVHKLAKAVGARAIATLRSPSQGGGALAAPSTRSSRLKEICRERFAYVDVEYETDFEWAETLADVAHRHRAQIIVSHHFAVATELSRVSDAIEKCGQTGDVAKVVVPVPDIEAAVGLTELARTASSHKRRVVVIGTGPPGMLTRALAASLGQEIQYASWDQPVDSGQFPLATAARIRNGDPILLGLLGHPIGHSISPAVHEAACAVLRLPAVYLALDVPPHALDALLDAAPRLHLRGFNVTIPYKETIVEKLDELDADAERIGAVNTVVIEDGWTKGHNTDGHGFRLSLRSLGLRLGDRRVLVIGAGGAAKAVVDVCLREGARVEVANRTTARAEALADAFRNAVDVIPMDDLAGSGPWDLLVNATPAWTNGFGADVSISAAVVARASFIYDMGYNPPNTPLLQTAQRLRRPGTSGLDMLLHQAAAAFELWTGHPAPFDAMRRAATEALR